MYSQEVAIYVEDRIKSIDKTAVNIDRCYALGLFSNDVNEERALIELSEVYPEFIQYMPKNKCAYISYDHVLNKKERFGEYREMVSKLRSLRYSHQQRVRDQAASKDMKILDNLGVDILKELDNYDVEHYNAVIKHLQEFADCGFDKKNGGFDKISFKPCNKNYPRPDIANDAKLDCRSYALAKIYKEVESFDIMNKMRELEEKKILDPKVIVEFEKKMELKKQELNSSA